MDIKVKLIGEVAADAPTDDAGAAVAGACGAAITEGVSAYDGDFLDETVAPEVSEPDIAGDCSVRVAQQICEADKQGIKVCRAYIQLH